MTDEAIRCLDAAREVRANGIEDNETQALRLFTEDEPGEIRSRRQEIDKLSARLFQLKLTLVRTRRQKINELSCKLTDLRRYSAWAQEEIRSRRHESDRLSIELARLRPYADATTPERYSDAAMREYNRKIAAQTKLLDEVRTLMRTGKSPMSLPDVVPIKPRRWQRWLVTGQLAAVIAEQRSTQAKAECAANQQEPGDEDDSDDGTDFDLAEDLRIVGLMDDWQQHRESGGHLTWRAFFALANIKKAVTSELETKTITRSVKRSSSKAARAKELTTKEAWKSVKDKIKARNASPRNSEEKSRLTREIVIERAIATRLSEEARAARQTARVRTALVKDDFSEAVRGKLRAKAPLYDWGRMLKDPQLIQAGADWFGALGGEGQDFEELVSRATRKIEFQAIWSKAELTATRTVCEADSIPKEIAAQVWAHIQRLQKEKQSMLDRYLAIARNDWASGKRLAPVHPRDEYPLFLGMTDGWECAVWVRDWWAGRLVVAPISAALEIRDEARRWLRCAMFWRVHSAQFPKELNRQRFARSIFEVIGIGLQPDTDNQYDMAIVGANAEDDVLNHSDRRKTDARLELAIHASTIEARLEIARAARDGVTCVVTPFLVETTTRTRLAEIEAQRIRHARARPQRKQAA